MKKYIKYLLIPVVLAAGIYLLGWGIMKYEQWHGQKRVQELAEELERIEKEQFEKKKADTIGGKTPQETLAMFISAVEAKDYELASKYFVIEKQEEELKSLLRSKQENINNVMRLLRQTKEGEFSFDNKKYIIHEPIFISFILYPSGNWKIEEI